MSLAYEKRITLWLQDNLSVIKKLFLIVCAFRERRETFSGRRKQVSLGKSKETLVIKGTNQTLFITLLNSNRHKWNSTDNVFND